MLIYFLELLSDDSALGDSSSLDPSSKGLTIPRGDDSSMANGFSYSPDLLHFYMSSYGPTLQEDDAAIKEVHYSQDPLQQCQLDGGRTLQPFDFDNFQGTPYTKEAVPRPGLSGNEDVDASSLSPRNGHIAADVSPPFTEPPKDILSRLPALSNLSRIWSDDSQSEPSPATNSKPAALSAEDLEAEWMSANSTEVQSTSAKDCKPQHTSAVSNKAEMALADSTGTETTSADSTNPMKLAVGSIHDESQSVHSDSSSKESTSPSSEIGNDKKSGHSHQFEVAFTDPVVQNGMGEPPATPTGTAGAIASNQQEPSSKSKKKKKKKKSSVAGEIISTQIVSGKSYLILSHVRVVQTLTFPHLPSRTTSMHLHVPSHSYHHTPTFIDLLPHPYHK